MKRVQIAFVALVIFNLSWRYLTVLIWLAFKVCLKLTLGPRGKERFTNGETIGIGSWRLSGIGGSRIISSLVHFPLLIKCYRSLTFSLFKVLVCGHWGLLLVSFIKLISYNFVQISFFIKLHPKNKKNFYRYFRSFLRMSHFLGISISICKMKALNCLDVLTKRKTIGIPGKVCDSSELNLWSLSWMEKWIFYLIRNFPQ